MKDIKSLYLTAKNRGWDADISAYNEAVNELLKSDPNTYVSNLEYIISSSSGIDTFKEFVSTYGFSVALYEHAMGIVEDCIHKCERDGKPTTSFIEAKELMEKFRKENIHSFAMYEWYRNEDMSSYISTYYSMNPNGIQNRKLVKGMIDKFSEAAIPDILITAKQMGEKATKTAVEFIESYEDFATPIFYEYLSTLCKLSDESKAKTASAIVESMKIRNNEVFRESVISGDTNAVMEYSEEEVEAIKDLISFKEYNMLWGDEFGIPMTETANEIYSLYEEIDGMEFTESDESNKKDDDLVPIFCLLRHYGDEGSLPDEIKKNENWKRSVNLCKVIGKVSGGDQYSHAVLAFDEECKEMYSFESMGIVKDSWDSEYWSYTTSIYMSVMFIPKKDKEKIHKMCKDYAENPKTTQYAYSDLIHLFIGTRAPKQNRRFVCSGFTAFMLAAANPKNIHRDYSDMRPEDITILPRSFYVANVKNAEDFASKKQLIHDKVKAIKDEHLDELEDYNNNLPRLLLQETMREKKFLDKILDSLMGSKLNSRMREED